MTKKEKAEAEAAEAAAAAAAEAAANAEAEAAQGSVLTPTQQKAAAKKFETPHAKRKALEKKRAKSAKILAKEKAERDKQAAEHYKEVESKFGKDVAERLAQIKDLAGRPRGSINATLARIHQWVVEIETGG